MQIEYRRADRSDNSTDRERIDLLPISDRLWDSAQPLVSIAFTVLAFGTLRPLGLSGYPLVLLILGMVSALATLTRMVPERILGEPLRFYCIGFGIMVSAALLGCASDTFASAFIFLLSGHAGFRYPIKRAVALGLLASLSCMAALVVAAAVHHGAWQWYLGFFAGWPVLVGIARRNRRETLNNAQLVMEQTLRASESEAREKALAERARIARDIHDVLAHSLSGVNMQLELASALFDAGQDQRAQLALNTAKGMVRDGLTEARRAVTAPREDALPLPLTLAGILDSGADFDVTGEPRVLSAEATQCLVRAAQESVTNVRRHAPDAEVSMTLSYLPSLVQLIIVNGPSPQPQSAQPHVGSGMGLVGMRERAALLSGSVCAGPTDSSGWQVSVELPNE